MVSSGLFGAKKQGFLMIVTVSAVSRKYPSSDKPDVVILSTHIKFSV